MKTNRIARVMLLAAGLTMATQPVFAALASGMLLTNFASATYALPSGAGVGDTDPGTNSINVPNSATAWVIVTDQPQLCLKFWKVPVAYGSFAPTTGQYPGNIICFTIGFSNCGNFSGMSVHITDMMPSNVVRSALPPGAAWTTGVPSPVCYTGWATALSGPWYSVAAAGQLNPHYLRWILCMVGMHKTGYIRYCVTIL